MSARPCRCGAPCAYEGQNADQPCYGDVRPVAEIPDGEDGYMWVHACDGHLRAWDGEPYIPEKKELNETKTDTTGVA